MIGKEDINLGYGTFGPVTLPDGSSATLNKVNPVPFIDAKASPYNAQGNGTTDDTTAINAALTAAATVGGAVFLPQGIYKITGTLIVPAGVMLFGLGRLSEIKSAITSATPNAEMVRLSGDYSVLSSVWLHGPGQGDGSYVDGTRGVWIGSLADHTLTGIVNYCRVENCIITETIGNGISGNYCYSSIVNNAIITTTDACIHIQPECRYNLVQGNIFKGCRYSGVDMNGGDNRIIGNHSEGNGGGVLDLNSWAGILMANVDDALPCSNNIVEGNRIKGNLGSGIFVFGSTGGSVTIPASGNIIKANVISGHITVTAGAHVPCGIQVTGCVDTIVEGNILDANRDQILVVGSGGLTSTGVQVKNNKSFNATRHGYFFPNSPRVDLAGDNPAQRVEIIGNSDRLAAGDSFRFQPTSAVMGQYTISDNRSLSPTGYCFNNTDQTRLYDYYFRNNYGSGAGVGYQAGFGFRYLISSATPDVTNGETFATQNAGATTITNFLGGIAQQRIVVSVTDSNTTFAFNGSSLKGNGSVNYKASIGDVLFATYDGTFWNCVIQHISGSPATTFANVSQSTSKTTDVTQNNCYAGRITMIVDGSGIAASSYVSFDLLNNQIADGDTIFVSITGGTVWYAVNASNDGAGKAKIYVHNLDSSSNHDDGAIIDYEIRKH